MTLTINGEERQCDDGTSVLALLEALQLGPQATVVELNGDILDRAGYADTTLANGDTLELVRLVGGG